MIVDVDSDNLEAAGYVHAMAWQDSHRSFCSEEFVRSHTPQAQMEYLRRMMEAGKRIYMLIDELPVGIVSVDGCMIADLYVLPKRQRRGYGSMLLYHAINKCVGTPVLWVMNINTGARRLYERNGFEYTESKKMLKNGLAELEMRLVHEK